VYVADGDQVVLFPRRAVYPQPVGIISDGVSEAYGVFVDAKSNLYVCNQSGSVTVYPPGQTSPSFTYSSGLSRPLYAAADSQRLFVGNANGGTIVEYSLGNAQPNYMLQTPGVETDGLALDDNGNLYAAYRTGNGDTDGGIVVFEQGTGTGQDLGITLDAPQGLAIDGAGNLIVAQTQEASNVVAFQPGQTQPFAQTAHIDGAPTGIALNRGEGRLFFSDLAAEVERVRSPSLTNLEQFTVDYTLTAVQGMALSPPGMAVPSPSPSSPSAGGALREGPGRRSR
jgi:hypothetical protein